MFDTQHSYDNGCVTMTLRDKTTAAAEFHMVYVCMLKWKKKKK